jgi:plastocyanin
MLNGIDANGNGLIEPVAGEGGAYTIYFQSQAMAAMGALTEEALSGLPTPAPPTATPRPDDTPVPTATVGPTATTGPLNVIYRNFEIVPNNIVIKAGTTIIFFIQDSLHEPYTFDDAPAFDSGPNLGDGTTYQRTFNNVGTFTILCGYHANMSATLTVTP